MWKLLSKASIAAAAAALAITTMSAPANAEDASPAQASEMPTTMQGTPVPLPRPLPEGNQKDSAQKQDESLDVVALPKELLDKLPQSGVIPPELTGKVRDVVGDRLDRTGSIELPNRRLVSGPNDELVLIDPQTAGKGDGVASADRPVQAQQNKGGGQAAPTADLGAIVQSLLQPNGPLAGLQGLNGG